MRVTSAIYVMESPCNRVEAAETSSLQQPAPSADHVVSRAFISLYSGKPDFERIGRSNGAQSAGVRPLHPLDFSVDLWITCTGT